nr:ATP-dependent DNA helicase PIF1-like [Tanacetum cinerariifolium]
METNGMTHCCNDASVYQMTGWKSAEFLWTKININNGGMIRIVQLQPPDGNRIDIDQIARPSTSKYASTRLRRRSAGPLHLRLAKKATKKDAFTSAWLPTRNVTVNEVRNRKTAFIDKDTSDCVDQHIVRDDPDGYKVVTDYMLHGPCGKDARYATCTTDGKCSKHFPKAFLPETFLDEESPLKLWEKTWQILSEDILHKKRKIFNYHELQLTDIQIRNYCLLEIQDLLHRYGRSLEDFKDLPWPDPSLLTNMDNCLIREALDFDIKKQIMAETYPDFTSRQTEKEYLKERAILTPRNEDADAVNEFMFKKLSGEAVTKNSADEICQASTDNIDQHQLYPVEFLNSLNFPGMPPHELCLKKNYQSCSYGMSTQSTDSAMKLD